MMRRCWLALSAIVAAVAFVAGSARAHEGRERKGGRGAVKLLTTIPIPNTKDNPNHLGSFDISFLDAGTQLYYLADRSDKAVDVVDAKRNVFVKQINKGGFKGFAGSNDTAGPNGVVVSGHWLFVTDAPSRVVTPSICAPTRSSPRLPPAEPRACGPTSSPTIPTTASCSP